ncbi:MAG: FHA domain-containing protein [Acidimicrobiia bacterium]
MVCRQCGHRNDTAARFCSSCGASLDAAADEGDSTVEIPAMPRVPQGAAVLHVVRGPNAGSTYALEGPSTSIGRHPDSDVFLDDITVSRRHCDVVQGSDGFVVRDVGSLNGTYVNRERVDVSALHDGDEIQVGRFHLAFHVGT